MRKLASSIDQSDDSLTAREINRTVPSARLKTIDDF